MLKVELLAPAGDMDALKAAVENGADAVYIGGKNFSARQYAGNFDDDEILEAVKYCHIRGVKIYVTLNILVRDIELADIPSAVYFLYNAGVDALIIQDIGVGHLIRKILPDLKLHASTQMTAHNLEGVNLLYSLGYKRVVLSRELSLKEINNIASNTEAEIEIFVHGAMCICYSGQCLMSSVIGGRSGNRGRCAQPCRMKYSIDAGDYNRRNAYLLSPKDLSTIEHIGDIIKSGAVSIKVEGRMKKPEYVAAVISTYRRAIDNYIDHGCTGITSKDEKSLLMAFNRGGFTTAHMFNKGGAEMMSIERPKNWGVYIGNINKVCKNKNEMEITLEDELSKGDGIEIWTKNGDNPGFIVEYILIKGRHVESGKAGDKAVLEYRGGEKGDRVYKTMDKSFVKSLHKTYTGGVENRKVPINCSAVFERCKPSYVELSDHDGNTAGVFGPVPEKAVKVPLDEERLKNYISKTGGTPFYIKNINIKLDPNLSLPASVINNMRRKAVDDIINKRISEKMHPFVDEHYIRSESDELLNSKTKVIDKDMKLSVFVRDLSLLKPAIKGGADIIIFGGDILRGLDMDYAEAVSICKENGVEIYIAAPRIIRQEFDAVMDKIYDALHIEGEIYGGIYADNLGAVKYAIDHSIPYAAGFALNIFNRVSAKLFNDSGSSFISLSQELSVKDIEKIAPYFKDCEALCYGRIEMMVSEYCPVGSLSQNCGKDSGSPICMNKDIKLTDRMNMKFPVRTDIYCRSHIFNSKLLSMIDNLKDLADAGINIFRLNMLEEDCGQVFNIVRAFKESIDMLNSGKSINSESLNSAYEFINETGYTKGHYYKSVE